MKKISSEIRGLKTWAFFCEHTVNLLSNIMLISPNICRCYILLAQYLKGGASSLCMSEIWLQNVCFSWRPSPWGQWFLISSASVYLGVDHMCLTRHSVGTLSHHLSCWPIPPRGGVPSTIWDIDVERTDRTFWGWERREGTPSLSAWMTMTAVGQC